MQRLVAVVVLVLALTVVGAARAGELRALRVAPAEDVALPFWCDWSYDWEARCWRDFSDRLPIGGDDDKVWRSALRFDLGAIPEGSYVLSATLELSFDRVCVAPRMGSRVCPPRAYTIDIHPIHSADWFHEREVDLGPYVTGASFATGEAQRLSWDVTDQVIEWVEYGAPNNGLLLKLADSQEQYGESGPKLPSGDFADPALWPALEVRYVAG